MDKVSLPPRYNYVEAYLTLRCNLRCPYCINKNGELVRVRQEISAEDWIQGLNRIDFGRIPLTLGGGEPTQHTGFFDILDGLNSQVRIDLLTNLQFNIDEFIERTTPQRFSQSSLPGYRAIRASYHRGQVDPKDLVERARKLQDAGYSIGIFGLDHPTFINENMEIMEMSVAKGIFFFPKNFMGEWNGQLYGTYKYPAGLDGKKKEAICRTRELLIDPEGKFFRCHRDLYVGEGSIGSISDERLKFEDVFRPCSNYGECNPCDVKLKTNFYLNGIDCQVEIKDKNGREN